MADERPVEAGGVAATVLGERADDAGVDGGGTPRVFRWAVPLPPVLTAAFDSDHRVRESTFELGSLSHRGALLVDQSDGDSTLSLGDRRFPLRARRVLGVEGEEIGEHGPLVVGAHGTSHPSWAPRSSRVSGLSGRVSGTGRVSGFLPETSRHPLSCKGSRASDKRDCLGLDFD
jgi:hypothetical protein